MAHTTLGGEHDYQLLQQRLDRSLTGAPDTPAFRKVLRLLFTPEEAQIARQIPSFISVTKLAGRVGVDAGHLDEHLTEMAHKGLVVDLYRGDRRYVTLAPVVIGFYEFTFMRTRDDAPMEELAALFEECFDEGSLARAVFQANTQMGRSLVREETLPDDATVEILDWERATAIVAGADTVGVSLCPCRHHARLIDRGCDAPLRACMTFNGAARGLIRNGIAEEISAEEGLAILEESKAAGLAQTADNVQRDVSFMCNCCGCCCGMMRSIKQFGLTNGIVESNWVATIDHGACRGCSKCVKACPVDAITLEETGGRGLRKNWAVLDADRCLGCGVCHDVCRHEAHAMEPRPERVYTPETGRERMTVMALERGKLGEILIGQVNGNGGHALARVRRGLEQ